MTADNDPSTKTKQCCAECGIPNGWHHDSCTTGRAKRYKWEYYLPWIGREIVFRVDAPPKKKVIS